MADANDLRALALALPGTEERPHMDRAAFRVARTYATLAADGLTANLRLTPDEQAFKCLLAPDAFSVIPNGWGRQGWTCATLDRLEAAELADALRLAWERAGPSRTRRAS